MDSEISNLIQQLSRRLSAVSLGEAPAALPLGVLPPLPFNKIKIIDDDQISHESISAASYTAYSECSPITVVAGPKNLLLGGMTLRPQPTVPFFDQDADPRNALGKQYLTRSVSVTMDLQAVGGGTVTRTIIVGAPGCNPMTGYVYNLDLIYKGLGFDPLYPAKRAFLYLISWTDNNGQLFSNGTGGWIYV